MDKNDQLKKITDEYLKAFLGFSINKIQNIEQAEELAQEIACQCIEAIHKENIKSDFNAYVWSIAHNTYKRWCMKKKKVFIEEDINTFSNVVSNENIENKYLDNEEIYLIRISLSRLTKEYRKVLVCVYYEEMSISETAEYLSLSEGMVKFYLRAGKQKLKENFDMNNIGEKSFNPSEFSVYKSAIDFSKVNVWEVFKRKLPAQIAIICHDSQKTISDISVETGTPSVYIEEELELLIDAGVMISPIKGKYQTNFHILKKNAAEQIKQQFKALYNDYAPVLIKTYEDNINKLKECGIFKFDASENQWKWFFLNNISEFDYDGFLLSNEEYPQILSCGSKGFIFAEESKGSIWGAGTTPTYLDKCTVYPCDVIAFGEYRHQKNLWDAKKAQALYDVYIGNISDGNNELYAELIKDNYVIKSNGNLYCNVAVLTERSRMLFNDINISLNKVLSGMCKEIRKNIDRIVDSTVPAQLKRYAKGFRETWISFYSSVYLREEMYNKGFITIPEDNVPVACWIYEK